MLRLRVVFYGVLKQDAGAKAQDLALDADRISVGELKAVLAGRYPALAGRLDAVACAVGDALVGPDYALQDGDEVALLPPVSGG